MQVQESVCPIAGAEPILSGEGTAGFGNVFQHPVSGLGAEDVIVYLEVFNVGADDGIGGIGVLGQPLGNLLIEIFPAIQPGKPVILKLVYHGGVLLQLNQVGGPVQDDFWPVGLGNKVRCAVGQGVELILFAVALGGDDYGDEGKAAVGAQVGQKGIAVHHRHHYIQKD